MSCSCGPDTTLHQVSQGAFTNHDVDVRLHHVPITTVGLEMGPRQGVGDLLNSPSDSTVQSSLRTSKLEE